MLKKIEHRAVMKFLLKQGKTLKSIRQDIVPAYQDFVSSLSTIQNWSNEFKRQRASIEDEGGRLVPLLKKTSKSLRNFYSNMSVSERKHWQ